MFVFQNIRIKHNLLEKYLFEIAWKPNIERADIPTAYITTLPYNSHLTGQFNRVPLLIGITSEESLCKLFAIK